MSRQYGMILNRWNRAHFRVLLTSGVFKFCYTR